MTQNIARIVKHETYGYGTAIATQLDQTADLVDNELGMIRKEYKAMTCVVFEEYKNPCHFWLESTELTDIVSEAEYLNEFVDPNKVLSFLQEEGADEELIKKFQENFEELRADDEDDEDEEEETEDEDEEEVNEDQEEMEL
jgi:hypothetical protein